MRRARRLAALGTSLGLAAASALTAITTTTAEAKFGDQGTGRIVNVFVAEDNSVLMSQRLRPGAHKFVIRSAAPAGFQLVQPDAGYTKREAARDVFMGLVQGRMPALRRFERNITLLGGMASAPGDPATMWADLDAGKYWALDTFPARPRVNDILTVRVSGTPLRGSFDRGAVIRAVNEADWARRPAAIQNSGRLTFRNNSEDNHFVELVRLNDGETIRDFRRWINQLQQGVEAPPPVDFSQSMSTGVVSPGHAMTTRYSLPPGNYVLICFWPDADMGGMPHAFMGMFRGIRLR